MARHSDESRARISRGVRRAHERRRQAALLGPRDLVRLRREGVVSPALQPLVDLGEQEMAELVEQLGGPDQVSPARRALLEDAVALGVALRAEVGRFLSTHDSGALERVATLANSRRANLAAAGLDRVQDDPLDVTAYAAALRDAEAHQDRPGDENATTVDAEPAQDRERAGGATPQGRRAE